MAEDFYDILGVSKTASADEIKKAYKKAAMKHHPDRGGDEVQFKKINEAYETLKDPNKKSYYDSSRNGGGFSGFNNSGNGFGGFHHEFHSNFGHPFDFDFMFNNFKQQRRPVANKDITVNYKISLEEAFTGKSTVLNVKVGNENKTIDLNIPPGIDDGVQIRFMGEGMTEHKELPPGNLFVVIHIMPHKKYERFNSDIHARISVDALEAISGTYVMFDNIDDTTIKVKVPEGTQPGQTLRIPGKGMPMWRDSRSKDGARGDLYLTLDVKVPKMSELNEDIAVSIKKAMKLME